MRRPNWKFVASVGILVTAIGCAGRLQAAPAAARPPAHAAPTADKARQRSRAGTQGATMIKFDANSHSLILRSTHILLLHIEAATPGEWQRQPTGGMRRENTLTAHLVENFKQATRERASDKFTAKIVQYSAGVGQLANVQGVWSQVSAEPGTDVVVFASLTRGAQEQSPAVADLLREPACLQVLLASEALTDVRLAARAANEPLKLPEFLAIAEKDAPRLGHLFPEYLLARFGNALFSTQAFVPLMRLLETPALSQPARITLMDEIDTRLTTRDPAQAEYLYRYIVTLFRLLALPETAPLHANLLEVTLPNTLGLEGGLPPLKASVVFHAYPQERSRAEQTLQANATDPAASKLLHWLRQPE